VAPVRAEESGSDGDLCLARALAPPAESWRTAAVLLSQTGRLIYWAGRSWGEGELEQLARVGATAEICLKPEFQWQGPLVIMTRSSPPLP
jgi:hypothetical protein